MVERIKKLLTASAVISFFAPCQNADGLTVRFYRAVSSSSDTKMISMTQDLLFNQMSAIEGITLQDFRDTLYTEPDLVDSVASHGEALVDKSGTISFYAEIQESADGDGGWTCTVNGINSATGRRSTKTGTYSSYYKILLDAKNLVTYILNGAKEAATPANAPVPAAAGTSDSISGSWASVSESHIDKVMILRGGRGFVIFKSGATMSVSVRISGSTIEIVQAGKPNASFFPELPREAALESAPTAPPVTWSLTVTGTGLMGTKSTLIMQDGAVVPGTVAVQWQRKQ